jgi:hypothetical protein
MIVNFLKWYSITLLKFQGMSHKLNSFVISIILNISFNLKNDINIYFSKNKEDIQIYTNYREIKPQFPILNYIFSSKNPQFGPSNAFKSHDSSPSHVQITDLPEKQFHTNSYLKPSFGCKFIFPLTVTQILKFYVVHRNYHLKREFHLWNLRWLQTMSQKTQIALNQTIIHLKMKYPYLQFHLQESPPPMPASPVKQFEQRTGNAL